MIIAWNNPDTGTLSLTYLAAPMLPGEFFAWYASRVAAKDVPAGVRWWLVDPDLLPRSKAFRPAWTAEPGQPPTVDMAKARVIHATRIVRAQQGELDRLAGEHSSALADDDQQAMSAAKGLRQQLRQLDLSLDRFTTPEDLDAFWPVELGGRIA